jgi:RimJ/RimL family protein N-acetyltransferase
MKFNSIKTQRLLIRRLYPGDSKIISGYRSDPKVSEYQSWDNFSEKKALELIHQMESSEPTDKTKWFQFGIELQSNQKLIGDIGFLNSDSDGKSWVGFTLDSNFWNNGFAVEAVTAILKYYSELGISDVWASVHPENESSIKLLLKLGFSLVETKLDDLIFKNL